MSNIERRNEQQPKIPDGNLNRRLQDGTGPDSALVISPSGIDSAVGLVYEIGRRRNQRGGEENGNTIPFIGGSPVAEGTLFDQAWRALEVYCIAENKRPAVHTGHVSTVVDFRGVGEELPAATHPLPPGTNPRKLMR